MLPCAGERRGSTDSQVRATAWQLPYQAGGRGVPQFRHVSVVSVGWGVETAFCPGGIDGGAQHETAVASKGLYIIRVDRADTLHDPVEIYSGIRLGGRDPVSAPERGTSTSNASEGEIYCHGTQEGRRIRKGWRRPFACYRKVVPGSVEQYCFRNGIATSMPKHRFKATSSRHRVFPGSIFCAKDLQRGEQLLLENIAAPSHFKNAVHCDGEAMVIGRGRVVHQVMCGTTCGIFAPAPTLVCIRFRRLERNYSRA